MVTFKMIKKEGEIYTYEYFPEGKNEARGEFCFDHANKKLIYHEESKTHERCYYLHVVSGLFDKNGNHKTSGMVAWY